MNPKGKNCSIAALILGIVSIVLCFPYILSALAMPAASRGSSAPPTAKNTAWKRDSPPVWPPAGLVLSIIGLTLSSISFFTCTLCVTCVGFVL